MNLKDPHSKEHLFPQMCNYLPYVLPTKCGPISKVTVPENGYSIFMIPLSLPTLPAATKGSDSMFTFKKHSEQNVTPVDRKKARGTGMSSGEGKHKVSCKDSRAGKERAGAEVKKERPRHRVREQYQILSLSPN